MPKASHSELWFIWAISVLSCLISALFVMPVTQGEGESCGMTPSLHRRSNQNRTGLSDEFKRKHKSMGKGARAQVPAQCQGLPAGAEVGVASHCSHFTGSSVTSPFIRYTYSSFSDCGLLVQAGRQDSETQNIQEKRYNAVFGMEAITLYDVHGQRQA